MEDLPRPLQRQLRSGSGILLVAQNRVALVGQVPADLMGAAGLDPQLDVARLAVGIEQLHQGGGHVAVDVGSHLFPFR